jgi:hypothetical protein
MTDRPPGSFLTLLRLGARIALAGGRTSLVGLAVTSVAVAIGTAIVLFALSFQPALDARYERSAWRNVYPFDAGSHDPTRDLLISVTEDRFHGQPITRIDVAALGAEAPLPPGLEAWPKTGETVVSPALQALLAITPPDQLGDRFGTVVGTLGESGLRSPSELAAVVGTPPDVLRLRQATLVNDLDVLPTRPSVSFVITVMVFIAAVGALAPVVVFVSTATRLTAAGRERRLALLRLLGASSGQTQLLAVGESVVAIIPGALLGIALFFVARPLVASLQVDQADWFVDAIVPPMGGAALALIGVPLLGVAAALFALRRLRVSPLGAVRQQRPKPPSPVRLLPLGLATAFFLTAIGMAQGLGGRTSMGVIWIGIGFFGLVVGLAIAGPWLTGVLGRALGRLARGPVGLLASRRLTDAPSGAFGAISGVVMAVFVASAFSVLIGFAAGTADQSAGVPLLPGTVTGSVGAPIPDALVSTPRLVADLRASAGVAAVADIREGMLGTSEGGVLSAWIVRCGDVVATLRITATCDGAQAWTGPRSQLDPRDGLSFLDEYVFGLDNSDPRYPKPEQLPTVYTVGSFQVDDAFAFLLPDVLIDPSLLADGGARFPLDRLLVATDGSVAVAEQVRTLVERTAPGTRVLTAEDLQLASFGVLGEAGRIVALGTLGTLLMAGCSLAVSVAAGIIDRRRPLALLRLTGMPLGRLRATMLLEAGTPLIVTAVISAALGVLAGEVLLQSLASVPVPPPDPWLISVLGAGLLGAMLVVAGALPLLGRVTSTEATRFE